MLATVKSKSCPYCPPHITKLSKTNSLAAWRNHINPDQPPTETWRPQFGENEEQNPSVDYVPAQKSPLGGFGAIGCPKQFVPQDYELVNPDYIVVGSDWANKDYYSQMNFTQEWLDERNIGLIYIPYSKDISSSQIKNRIK